MLFNNRKELSQLRVASLKSNVQEINNIKLSAFLLRMKKITIKTTFGKTFINKEYKHIIELFINQNIYLFLE